MGKLLRSLSQRLQKGKNSAVNEASTSCNDNGNLPSKSVGLSSGSFNAQPFEPFNARRQCQCKVLLLDGTDVNIIVGKKVIAQEIYDRLFEFLDLEERDYFGLQFTDHYHVQHWLDPLKKIHKQVPIGPPYTFRFRVKFYSSEPSNLKEELTRYQFFLQLKNDIQTGILPCSRTTAVELAMLALQSEFGDFNPREHTPAFVSEFRFHPLQDAEMEISICEAYASPNAICRGMSPADAELAYLNRVKWLELYGVDMHMVEGKDGNHYRLGLTPTGVLVFDGDQKIGLFFWEKIQRLDFRNRKLTLVVEEDIDEGTSSQIQLHTFIFELASHKACKHLWKCAIEHHTFFRLKHHSPPRRSKGQFFRLGSTFKYRGRTEYENIHRQLVRDNNELNLSHNSTKNFERRPSQRHVPRQNHIEKQRFRENVREMCMSNNANVNEMDLVNGPNYIAGTIMNTYTQLSQTSNSRPPRLAPLVGLSSTEETSSLDCGMEIAESRHSSPSATSSSGIGSSCGMSSSGGATTFAVAARSNNSNNDDTAGKRQPSLGYVTTIAIKQNKKYGNAIATLRDSSTPNTKSIGLCSVDNNLRLKENGIGGGIINTNKINQAANNDPHTNICNNETNKSSQNDINIVSSCLKNRKIEGHTPDTNRYSNKNDEHCNDSENKWNPPSSNDTNRKFSTLNNDGNEVENSKINNVIDETGQTGDKKAFVDESHCDTTKYKRKCHDDNFDRTTLYDSSKNEGSYLPYRRVTGAYQHGISSSPTASPSNSKIVRFCNINCSNNSISTVNSSNSRASSLIVPNNDTKRLSRSPTRDISAIRKQRPTNRFNYNMAISSTGLRSAIPRPSNNETKTLKNVPKFDSTHQKQSSSTTKIPKMKIYNESSSLAKK